MLILRILTQMLIHRKPTIIVVTGLPIPTSSRSCPGTNFINEDQYYIIWRTSIKAKKQRRVRISPPTTEVHLLWTDDSVCDASQSLMHYWRAIWLSGVIWNWEKLLLHPRNFYSWFGFGSGLGACSEDIRWTCLGFAHHLGFLSLWFRLSSMLYSRRQLRRCWCSLALKPRWVPTSSSSLAPH